MPLPRVVARRQTRLVPAVELFCHQRGFSFTKIPDRGTGYVGAVDINFAGLLGHGVDRRRGSGGYTDDDVRNGGGGSSGAAACEYYER